MKYTKDSFMGADEPAPVPAVRVETAPDVTRVAVEDANGEAARLTRERMARNEGQREAWMKAPRRSFAEVRALVKAGVLPKVAP